MPLVSRDLSLVPRPLGPRFQELGPWAHNMGPGPYMGQGPYDVLKKPPLVIVSNCVVLSLLRLAGVGSRWLTFSRFRRWPGVGPRWQSAVGAALALNPWRPRAPLCQRGQTRSFVIWEVTFAVGSPLAAALATVCKTPLRSPTGHCRIFPTGHCRICPGAAPASGPWPS